MKIKVVLEKTKTGYSAYAEKEMVFTTGRSLQELKSNVIEALQLYYEQVGKNFAERDLQLAVDLPQFFEFYKVINAKALSSRIGMHQSLLAQYIKGIKIPSAKQTTRILKGIQDVGRELASIQFMGLN
jgi:predicted RNase H-like HicB family nuclease